MDMVGDVLGRLISDGVALNGLVIPGRSVERALSRYTFNLIVENGECETYKILLAGSATAVRYAGREILLTTQHQVAKVDLSRVAMLTDTGSHAITSGGVRAYKPNPDTDAHDIVAFDFSEPCRARHELKRRFFNLIENPPDVPSERIGAFLLSGYPFDDQKYDIEENNHLGLTRRNVACVLHSQPSDDALLIVKAQRLLEIDPDGMSGGSAFSIILTSEGPKAYLSGMIVRGGRELFYILKVGYITTFLDRVFS